MAYIIKIPDERGVRLKQLAAFRKKSIAETIGDLINAEFRKLGLAETIPGFHIEPIVTNKPGVRFEIDTPCGPFGFQRIEPELARVIADKVEVLATSAKPVKGRSIASGMGSEMHIARVGVSVTFANANEKAQSHHVAFGVAMDIASLLRSAADAADRRVGL